MDGRVVLIWSLFLGFCSFQIDASEEIPEQNEERSCPEPLKDLGGSNANTSRQAKLQGLHLRLAYDIAPELMDLEREAKKIYSKGAQILRSRGLKPKEGLSLRLQLEEMLMDEPMPHHKNSNAEARRLVEEWKRLEAEYIDALIFGAGEIQTQIEHYDPSLKPNPKQDPIEVYLEFHRISELLSKKTYDSFQQTRERYRELRGRAERDPTPERIQEAHKVLLAPLKSQARWLVEDMLKVVRELDAYLIKHPSSEYQLVAMIWLKERVELFLMAQEILKEAEIILSDTEAGKAVRKSDSLQWKSEEFLVIEDSLRLGQTWKPEELQDLLLILRAKDWSWLGLPLEWREEVLKSGDPGKRLEEKLQRARIPEMGVWFSRPGSAHYWHLRHREYEDFREANANGQAIADDYFSEEIPTDELPAPPHILRALLRDRSENLAGVDDSEPSFVVPGTNKNSPHPLTREPRLGDYFFFRSLGSQKTHAQMRRDFVAFNFLNFTPPQNWDKFLEGLKFKGNFERAPGVRALRQSVNEDFLTPYYRGIPWGPLLENAESLADFNARWNWLREQRLQRSNFDEIPFERWEWIASEFPFLQEGRPAGESWEQQLYGWQ